MSPERASQTQEDTLRHPLPNHHPPLGLHDHAASDWQSTRKWLVFKTLYQYQNPRFPTLFPIIKNYFFRMLDTIAKPDRMAFG